MIEAVVHLEDMPGLWKVSVNNDWALQNTVEHSRPGDIYFFCPEPGGYS